MRARKLSAIPLALQAVMMFASAALAGGWASVTMADPPSDITPGEETTVEMTVLQHDQTPVDWPKFTVVARNGDTGAIVRAQARAVPGHLGQYQATLTFPSDGDWAMTYESNDLMMEGTATVAVAPAPPVVPAVVPGASSVAEAAPAPTNLLLPFVLVVATIVGLGLIAALLMRRRPEPIDRTEQPIPSRG